MKRLTIIYNDLTVFDADVDEFQWQDTDTSVSVVGKTKTAGKSSSAGLLDMITQVSRKRTDAVVQEKKLELEDSE